MNNDHFRGKDALSHVAEGQAEGILASAEMHGLEPPGHLASFFEAMRETGLLFLFFSFIPLPFSFLLSLALGFAVWKGGRSALFGWSRLERLHRIVAQEKWEIEHHRNQEREELAELYRAKGFQSPLLEEVLDVLMADNERLLRVMVEEELKLSVQNIEHPLKHALGAFIGVIMGAFPFLVLPYFLPLKGFFISTYWNLILSLGIVGIASGFASYLQKNKVVPSLVWNLGLLITSWSFLFFLKS